MPNQEFNFKQFKLIHSEKGLKVNTDGVLLGAWAIAEENIERALDIGTGIGLIALITAQRFQIAQIDAIDINSEVIELAKYNFKNSPWPNRMIANNIDLNDFSPKKSYNLIVSNPPFFRNGLKPKSHINRETKHIESLKVPAIFSFSQQHLESEGNLNLIFPFTELEYLIAIGKSFNFSPVRITRVFPKVNLPSKRILISFKKGINNNLTEDSLILENDSRHDYHESYKKLCKELYLKF
jgi:tRNA1Val (adenine37-N6)-methyltransferase